MTRGTVYNSFRIDEVAGRWSRVMVPGDRLGVWLFSGC